MKTAFFYRSFLPSFFLPDQIFVYIQGILSERKYRLTEWQAELPDFPDIFKYYGNIYIAELQQNFQ